jgi:hypothetical protein
LPRPGPRMRRVIHELAPNARKNAEHKPLI